MRARARQTDKQTDRDRERAREREREREIDLNDAFSDGVVGLEVLVQKTRTRAPKERESETDRQTFKER